MENVLQSVKQKRDVAAPSWFSEMLTDVGWGREGEKEQVWVLKADSWKQTLPFYLLLLCPEVKERAVNVILLGAL